MRFSAFLLFVSTCLAPLAPTSAQDVRCHADEMFAVQMEDTSFARSYFAFEAAIADMQASNAQRSSQAYTLPIVVHIMHDGAPIGTGSNVSDAQVISAINALNADFAGAFGGADIDITFELAARDPEGNPSTGITRTNVSATIPSFSNTGMVTTSLLDPAAEMAVKELSHWPGEDYINVWVLHKLNGGNSPLGFAYLPPTSGTHDGIVLFHQVFGTGDEFNLMSNFDQNRTITHEMGHYLGLLHTFSNTASCNAETNCSAQGDKVCDTPPTTGSVGCSYLTCPETMVENFMDYSNDGCMEAFTEGQRTRMRDALVAYRTSLLSSEGTIPVSATDAGISSIGGIQNSGCATSLEPTVNLQNFGSQALTNATVHFSLDGGTVNTFDWTGNLASGAVEELTLPMLAAPGGSHELAIWTVTDGDGYALNDTMTLSFDVQDGDFVEMQIQFDALPYGISWSIEDTDDGSIVMSGEDYDNATYAGNFTAESSCIVNGCYELVVEDLFGNGLHYWPPGWYALTDSEGNELGAGSGNFGSIQVHAFCIEGGSVTPCDDINGNGICDSEEDIVIPDVPGCTDASSCTFDAGANVDDGSCEYLDALGDCGGNCPSDNDGDGVCDNAEIPGCMDSEACNYDVTATDDAGNCTYPPANYDCDGNVTVVISGCTDAASCTYDADANTDDGSCDYLDALGICGGDCPSDNDADGVCDNAEIPGCTHPLACNYDAFATDDDGGCTYPPTGLDCDGNPLVVVEGCTDPASCTYDAGANTEDGSCEYLDAIGACGGDCPADADADGVCDNAEIPGCMDSEACNYDATATDDAGNCTYPPVNYDCDGNVTVVISGCTDASSCTYDADANTDDGSCQYLDALGDCGGDCPSDSDADGVCDNAEIPGCMDTLACNYDAAATDDDGGCEYAPEGFDCAGNPLVVVEGCTDPASCTYDAEANTDDGSCDYLDALGECGGDCAADTDGDGVCDDAEIPGCTDEDACNYEPTATEEDGGCEYAAEGYDCEGNPLTSSVGDLSHLNGAIVGHPNPARLGGQVTLQGLIGSGPWIVEWWDASGRRVASSRLMAESNGTGWSALLDVPSSTGLHMVRMRTENKPDAAPFVSRILIH